MVIAFRLEVAIFMIVAVGSCLRQFLKWSIAFFTVDPRSMKILFLIWRLAKRIEIHYAPKHGSWLNMAEVELNALNGQSFDRRIPDMGTPRGLIAAWENDRNNRQAKIQWQFANAKARIKLKRLYPQL